MQLSVGLLRSTMLRSLLILLPGHVFAILEALRSLGVAVKNGEPAEVPERPIISLLSRHLSVLPGDTIRFSCTAPSAVYTSLEFDWYRSGVGNPIETKRALALKKKVELTVERVDTSHQGGYSCLYRVKINGVNVSSALSNFIPITVVDLQTPDISFSLSPDSPVGEVTRGDSFTINCSTAAQFPGGTFQLKVIRSEGATRQLASALNHSATFSFPSADSTNEGYYSCLYETQVAGRTFCSRESRLLPISVKESLMVPIVASWVTSAVIFILAVLVIALVVCKKRKKTRELERASRSCVENTYTELPLI
ncbi:low affinity immunoglobulin gamma Fc region receptor II-b isoform X3 [Amia ocellicauda]|uniref:low affinity immunoglobulin gamma Fc region receptor II-b isoform X3 n=1 Tax=Amia ocellicauda TaxID=2972642 RepID=UPI003464064C